MKKVIPIIAVISAGVLFTGCNSVAKVNEKETLENHIQNFQNQVEEYSAKNDIKNMNTKFMRYQLALSIPEDSVRVNSDSSQIPAGNSNIETANETNKLTNQTSDSEIKNNEIANGITDIIDDIKNKNTNIISQNEGTSSSDNITETDTASEQTIDTADEDTDEEINDTNQISTLYSLSADISDSCDDFCELKEEVSEAIIETQNLINKIQANEVTLTAEQRMFITEQAKQLKSLGKQLSNITTELSINLSDISNLMRDTNGNIDNLSIKYLVVLDNLVNGNEMLENGLSSLYMINSMFASPNELEPNNQGRILYGFRRNNEPPIIKDYTIENGEIKETKNTENNEETLTENDKKGNIDTYLNTNVNKNIDTYGNKYNNIDTFYNTALLDDNLYGNGYGYGMNGYPYGNQNNTGYSVENNQYRQNIEENKTLSTTNKEKKKFKLTSNIDTYRDENTPTLSAKIEKIKDSVSSFFGKFKPRNDNVKNPITRLTDNEKND